MELRHLRYFVTVAEELNFTRAAKRLGIKQPPLSLQIRQLEKEIGTPLFHRRARGIELTSAGKLLLEEARIILQQVERAKTGVRSRGRGETGRINLGSVGGTYFHPLIPAIIREYRMHYPDVVLFPQASSTSLVVARLRCGQIDAKPVNFGAAPRLRRGNLCPVSARAQPRELRFVRCGLPSRRLQPKVGARGAANCLYRSVGGGGLGRIDRTALDQPDFTRRGRLSPDRGRCTTRIDRSGKSTRRPLRSRAKFHSCCSPTHRDGNPAQEQRHGGEAEGFQRGAALISLHGCHLG